MYAKIFKSLWDGSLRGQPIRQLVFIYLLAHANRDGHVEVIQSKIADDTGLPLSQVNEAIVALEKLDNDSRSGDEEGRAIVSLDDHRSWGWRIVNYQRYRSIRNEDDRQYQNREAQSRFKAKAKDAHKAQVSQGKPHSAQGEGEGEGDGDGDGDVKNQNLSTQRRVESLPPNFLPAYRSYPRNRGRRAAAKAFERALKRHPALTGEDLIWACGQYAKEVEREGTEQQYIPHPATWLNQDRFLEYFEDEHETAQRADPAAINGHESE